MKRMSTAERVQQMLDELNLNQSELSRLAGATKGLVNQWLNGKTKTIGAKFAYRIESKSHFNARWILLGVGPPVRDKKIAAVIHSMERMDEASKDNMVKIGASLAKADSEFDEHTDGAGKPGGHEGRSVITTI